MYLDFHSHPAKKSSYLYANALTGEQQLYNLLYGKLISLNTLNFDIDNCYYDEKFMNCKDRNGLGREGCGRVAVN